MDEKEVNFDLGPIENFIAADKKHKFVSLVKEQLKNSESGISSVSLGEMLSRICLHRSTNCASALIAGETGLKLDLNAVLIRGGYPLHLAAHNLSFELVKLFLEHGARANVVADDKLPLQVALDAISHYDFMAYWSPEKSEFKLIYMLCLPPLRKPLEVVKLLSAGIDSKDVQKLASYCVEEGKLIQLAVLLMVNRESLLEPLQGYEADGSILGLYIAKKLSSVILEKYLLIADGKYQRTRSCKRMRDVMLSATTLLQIFERAGDAIEEYHSSIKEMDLSYSMIAVDITTLFQRFRFFGPSDRINCTILHLREDEIEELKLNLHKKSSMQGSVKQNKGVSSARTFSTCSQLPAPVPGHLVRSFHTCARPVSTSGFKLFKPVGTQVNGTITQVMHPVMPRLKTAMRICVLAFGMRRRIQYRECTRLLSHGK